MTAITLNFKLEDNGILRRMQKHGDLAGPFIGAALRRSMFAYRREFIAGRHKSNPVPFRGRNGFSSPAKPNARGRNINAFLIATKPRDEKRAKLNDISVRYYTESLIARALETGADIRPRRSRWLAIPVGIAKTPSGRTRKFWSSPEVLMRNKSNVKTRFVRRPGSREAAILVDESNVRKKRAFGPQTRRTLNRKDRKSRYRIAWKLVPRTKIPAKLGFIRGWERRGPALVATRAKAEYQNYLRKVWGIRS